MKFSILWKCLMVCLGLLNTCLAQDTPAVPAKIDTAKLFDPYPELEASNAGMATHALFLFTSVYIVVHNDIQKSFLQLRELSEYIGQHADSIIQKKFYLLIDHKTKFDKVVTVIDVLKRAGIKNYRVVDQYIKDHLAEIRGKKIYVIGKADLPYVQMKPVFDALKEYNLMQFELVPR